MKADRRRSIGTAASGSAVGCGALVLLAVCSASSGSTVAAPPQPVPSSARTLVVIGDLHFGAGRVSPDRWHPREDFRWAAEFEDFLSAIGRAGANAVDLILNGDTFDLAESAADACDESGEIGCTEAEALARLEPVLRAHAREMAALSSFAGAGSNRVVFVPGDADAALLFPAVARRVVDALEPADRVEVAAMGHWRSADGRIYVEHGQQIGFDPYALEGWPAPFVRQAGRVHLVRSWGEQIARPLDQRLETRYPVVDNIAARGMGLKYGLAAEDTADLTSLRADLVLRYVLFNFSWMQFRQELDDGEVQPPEWNLEAVRAQGSAFFVSALADDDPFKRIAQTALRDGRLDGTMAVSDRELTALCDYRAAVRRSRRRFEPTLSQLAPRGPAVSECPRTAETRGRIFDYFWRSRDALFLERLRAVESTLSMAPDTIAVFVHGHTHLPDRSQAGARMISGDLPKIPVEGFSPVRFATTPVVVNGGAWQRTITPVQFERLRAEPGPASTADLLRSLAPEDLAPCYGFVHVAPYPTGPPAPLVRYWRRAADGAWGVGTGCGQ